MDDFSGGLSEDDEGMSMTVIIVHIVLFIILPFGVCWRCCFSGGKGAATAAAAAPTVERTAEAVTSTASTAAPNAEGTSKKGWLLVGLAEQQHLQPKKSVGTAYLLFCAFGLVGAHHFYLNRPVHGLLCVWSLNFCGFGLLFDLVCMKWYVASFNEKFTAPNAPADRSCRRLCCRIPLLWASLVGLICGLIFGIPWAVNLLNIVDLDRAEAQTAANPYEILGLTRMASIADAKSAYRKESLRWHPDRNVNCGKDCEDKMSEITKAFDAIKKRRAPPPPDRSWKAYFEETAEGLGRDWMHIVTASEILSKV